MPPGPRERLIGSAIELLRTRGVEGTGVADLLEHSHTARGSIYQHFPGGKAELMATAAGTAGAWLRHTLREYAGQIDVASLLRGVIEQVAAELTANDYQHGCPVVAAAVAAPDATGVRESAADVFASWTEELAAALEQEGRSAAEARSLAGFVVSAVEGALLRARCAQSTEPLEQAAEQLAALLTPSSSE